MGKLIEESHNPDPSYKSYKKSIRYDLTGTTWGQPKLPNVKKYTCCFSENKMGIVQVTKIA